MKKILMGLMATGLISASAVAGETTISKIWVKDVATVLYFTNGSQCSLNATFNHSADYIQRMLATALTAKSSAATVYINIEAGGCKNMFIL